MVQDLRDGGKAIDSAGYDVKRYEVNTLEGHSSLRVKEERPEDAVDAFLEELTEANSIDRTTIDPDVVQDVYLTDSESALEGAFNQMLAHVTGEIKFDDPEVDHPDADINNFYVKYSPHTEGGYFWFKWFTPLHEQFQNEFTEILQEQGLRIDKPEIWKNKY